MPVLTFGREAVSVYAAKPPTKPKPVVKAKPPAKPGVPVIRQTIPYDPNAYVPGGSSKKVAVAIETQGLKNPTSKPVQVPIAVLTNLEQDTGVPLHIPNPPPPSATSSPSSQAYPQRGSLTREQIAAAWIANGGNPDRARLAADIAMCESSGITSRIDNTAYPSKPGYHKAAPNASPEYSVGLWQVNTLAHPQYSVSDLETADGNAKAIVAISGNGSRFAQTNVYCYAIATNIEGQAGAPPVPPLTSGPPEPASVHGAWSNLLTVLGTKVPEGLASITTNANGLWKVFR